MPPGCAAARFGQARQRRFGLHRDEELPRRLGFAGRRRIEEYFDVRQMVAGYERLYETVCGLALPACQSSAKRHGAKKEVHGCASHI